MKIIGVFRGFPGLGRVVSGVGLLNDLRKKGHDILGFSYMQGVDILNSYKINKLLNETPLKSNIMEIGLNPISKIAGELISKIIDENPDLVIIDGEALLASTLSLVFPKEKILTLLNPTDICNDSLPESTIAFYKQHYLSAGTAIVHMPNINADILPKEKLDCDLHLINTILRDEILNLKPDITKKSIVGILGGGCANSSDNFYKSTLEIGKKIVEVAKKLSNEKFLIYCNDKEIKKSLDFEIINMNNIKVIEEYTEPKEIYTNAKLIFCRSGRNTVSELLYLQIPAILFSSKGDFRSKEQEKNIDAVCKINPFKLKKSSIDETIDEILKKIEKLVKIERSDVEFIPGNKKALQIIEKILNNKVG